MEDIQQYLTGQMKPSARQAFEAQLATNDNLRTELEIHIGLQQLRLEQSVANAAHARRQGQRNRFWWPLLIVCAIVGLAGLAFFLKYTYAARSAKSSVPPPEIKVPEAVQPIDNHTDEIKANPVSPSVQSNPPIAQNNENSVARPLLRSVYTDLDPDTRQLLDTLITLTQQQKTLAATSADWQKAVQKLTSGQPAAAKSAALELEKTDPAEATWLLALALLGQGEIEAAEALLLQISRTGGHPRRALAKWTWSQMQ